MIEYNPNDVARKGSVFGYPYSIKEADLILLPVPWDVTVSYGAGTSDASELILEESTQLDLSLPRIQSPYKYPVAMELANRNMKSTSSVLRSKAEEIISRMENIGELSNQDKVIQAEINKGCSEMVRLTKEQAAYHLSNDKIVGLVGGDHSTPLGVLQALGEIHEEFGILQIDAHMDLRDSYEGFEHSPASIMNNAVSVSSISRIVQVGIRDYCEEEEDRVNELNGKVKVHFDETLQRERWKGISWLEQAENILMDLPSKVYISFDMDGLDPSLCPNTGTPVPGGLSFNQAVFLIEEVVRSGRELIGFDVSETGCAIWDANVAARILFRLCACAGVSRGRLNFA